MATVKLLEGCKALIEKDRESWKSYFSRWEVFAKYEEKIPESELYDCFTSVKNVKKKKRDFSHTKPKTEVSLKRSRRNQKKLINKKRFLKNRAEVKIIQKSSITDTDSAAENKEVEQLQTILQNFFVNVLKENKNKFEVFSVMSQTYSSREEVNSHNFLLTNQVISSSSTQLSKQFPILAEVDHKTICLPPNGTYTENSNLFCSPIFKVVDGIGNDTFKNSFPKCNIPRAFNNQTPKTKQLIPVSESSSVLLNSSRYKNTESNPLKGKYNHELSTNMCRKINREYFINRSFFKINIAQDGKRFRNSYICKKTNSDSLNIENSNLITSERKPTEQKCFSENVLQRKGGRPSKLFFDNEEDDSESDDQTQNQTPLIHFKSKKVKTQIIPENSVESDLDDCESIFDRIKKV